MGSRQIDEEEIVRQCRLLYTADAANQQNANDYLQNFQMRPDSLPVFLDILMKHDDLYSNIISASIIEYFVNSRWSSIDQSLRLSIRMELVGLMRAQSAKPAVIASQIHRIIATVGALELLTTWPDFLQVTLDFKDIPLLSAIQSCVLNSRIVQSSTKGVIQSFFLSHMDSILDLAFSSQTQDSSDLIHSLAQWAPASFLVAQTFISSLFSFPSALDILEAILVGRSDTFPAILESLPLIFSTAISQKDSLPILSAFICDHISDTFSSLGIDTFFQTLSALTDSSWALADLDQYWQFWACVISFFAQSPDNFAWFIPPLLECFFSALPSPFVAISDQCYTCFSHLSKSFASFLSEFAMKKDVSPSLLLFISCCIQPSSTSDIIPVIFKVSEIAEDYGSPDILCATLTCFARALSLISTDPQLISKFSSLSNWMIRSGSPTLIQAAASTLLILAFRERSPFYFNSQELEESVIGFLKTIPSEAYRNSSVIDLFRTISVVTSYQLEQNVGQQFVEEVLDGVFSGLANFEGDSQIAASEIRIILNFSDSSRKFAQLFSEKVLSILSGLLAKVEHSEASLISECFSLASSIFSMEDCWEKLISFFHFAVAYSTERPQLSQYVIPFFTLVSKCSKEAAHFFPAIESTLVEPNLKSIGESTPLALDYLVANECWKLDYPFSMETVLMCKSELPIHSIKSLFRFIDGYINYEGSVLLLEGQWAEILDLILSFIFDPTYSRYFGRVVKTFQRLCSECQRIEISADVFACKLFDGSKAEVPNVTEENLRLFVTSVIENFDDVKLLKDNFNRLAMAGECCTPFNESIFKGVDASTFIEEEEAKPIFDKEDIDGILPSL